MLSVCFGIEEGTQISIVKHSNSRLNVEEWKISPFMKIMVPM